jgi:nucleoid DNA-binding protein/cell division protein FtsN
MNTTTHPIWQVIHQLMHLHDCVIVPGFGGFVSNKEHARIDQVSHIILPPGKHVVFNPNLKTNDGLLAANFAEKAKLSYADALQQIEQFVSEFKDLLANDKQIEVDHFGKFRLNAEANFVFIPHTQNRYDYQSFGLTPIQANPVASRSINKKGTKLFREFKPIAEKPARSRRVWPTALAATLVTMLAINAWIFFQDNTVNDLRLGTSTLNIIEWFDSVFNHSEKPTLVSQIPAEAEIPSESETTPTLPETLTYDNTSPNAETIDTSTNNEPTVATSDDEPIAFVEKEQLRIAKSISNTRLNWVFPPLMEETTDETIVVTPPSAPEEIEPVNTDIVKPAKPLAINPSYKTYYIIAGVFCKERNARKYHTEMQNKGYSAEVLSNEAMNCLRVSVAKFQDKAEADSFLAKVKNEINQDAWILGL